MKNLIRLFILSLLAGALLQGLTASGWAQEANKQSSSEEKSQKQGDAGNKGESKKNAGSADKKKTEAPSAVVPQSAMMGLGSFGQLLPMGRKNVDVQIPSFKGGIPSSMLRADSMTRLDDSMMSMEKMDIWLYAANRESDVRVQLPTAEYNMTTQILTSDQRSRISRQDFQLEGDEMIFDTTTQQGKMTGRVEMIIFNTSAFTGAAPPASSESSEGSNNVAPTQDQDSNSPTSPGPNASASAQEGAANSTSPNHEKK